MATLKETLAKKIQEHRPRTTRLVKEFGDVKLGDVTISQAIGGAPADKRQAHEHSLHAPTHGTRPRHHTHSPTFSRFT